MLFNKQTKQAFVFPPKNGTHTVVNFLHQFGWHRNSDHHKTTDLLLSEYPNLNEYTIYGFLRDPIKRFESVILHFKQFPYTRLQFDSFLQEQNATPREQLSYDEFVDLIPAMPSNYQILLQPQSDWLAFPQVTVLDFNLFETELRRISGNIDQPIERYNYASEFGKSVITDKVRAFVRDRYAVDYQLARERLNADYAST